MARTGNIALVVTALAVVTGARAESPTSAPAPSSSGRNCFGEGRARLLATETLIVQTNPLGGENQLALGVCSPLIRSPGMLFDYTNLQAGLFNYLAPVYLHQGLYASVAPLSVLEIRAEFAGVAYWPLPILDSAGYFALRDYRVRFDDAELPASRAGFSSGANANLIATLQGQVELTKFLNLSAVDSFGWEYWWMTGAPYYYNVRRDLVLAASDSLLKNMALLLVELVAWHDVALRVGVTDDLSYVPQSGYLANILAALVSVDVKHWPLPGAELQPFLRAGVYTHHRFRSGPQILGGVSFSFDVMPR